MHTRIMKRVVLIVFLACVVLCGCTPNRPMNVSFKNQTLPFSKNYTLTTVYAEDKRLREKWTDILVMANTDNLELKFTKELGEEFDVVLGNKWQWQSLTKLFGADNFATFARAETTTYIINAQQPAKIWFKAVGGDLVHHLNDGTKSLTNLQDVSKPFLVEIE